MKNVCLFIFVLLCYGCANSALNYMNDGIMYYRQKEFKGALEKFDLALKQDPKLPEIYYHRGKLYADWEEIEDRYKKAIDDFTQSVSLDPRYTLGYNQRALVYRIQGDTDNALRDYQTILSIDPNNARAHYSIGILYKERYQTSKDIKELNIAKNSFNKAIEIDPENIAFYSDRAQIYLIEEEYQKAIDDYNKVIQLEPNDLRGLIDRGIAYFQMKEYNKAYRDFVQCEEMVNRYNKYRKQILQIRNK